MLNQSEVYTTLRQDIIVTDADKLRLRLLEYSAVLRGRSQWLAPAGILVAFLLARIATDFKATLWLSADSWEALCTIALLASCGWLLLAILRSIQAWRKGGIEEFINRLKVGQNKPKF